MENIWIITTIIFWNTEMKWIWISLFFISFFVKEKNNNLEWTQTIAGLEWHGAERILLDYNR